jgi:hypothetical protein
MAGSRRNGRARPVDSGWPEGVWCDEGATGLLGALVVAWCWPGTGPRWPAPPPADPSDGALARSREQVSARAAEVGQLTARLADLDSRTDDLQADLAAAGARTRRPHSTT